MIQFRRDPRPSRPCRFKPGALVLVDFGRGAVVRVDAACERGGDWAERAYPGADPDGPWCVVLRHDSARIDYAPESALTPDYSKEQIRHPLAPKYFKGFIDGVYLRNDVAFEESRDGEDRE